MYNRDQQQVEPAKKESEGKKGYIIRIQQGASPVPQVCACPEDGTTERYNVAPSLYASKLMPLHLALSIALTWLLKEQNAVGRRAPMDMSGGRECTHRQCPDSSAQVPKQAGVFVWMDVSCSAIFSRGATAIKADKGIVRSAYELRAAAGTIWTILHR